MVVTVHRDLFILLNGFYSGYKNEIMAPWKDD